MTTDPQPTALEVREKAIREHTLSLHLMGEQLSQIESWFWSHLADVREAARQELGGPLPDDVVPAVAQSAPAKTALRDQLRRALAEADGFNYEGLEPHDYQRHVDAVLAVLPAPADRAAILHGFLWRLEQSAGDAAAEKFLDDNEELRHLADEERAEREAQAHLDQLADELPAAAPTVSSVGQAAHTTRSAVLREAADEAERVAEGLRAHHEFERSTGALDVMTELRRLATEVEGAAEYSRALATPPSAEASAYMRERLAGRMAVEAQQQTETPADRAALSARLWAVAEHHIVAEWICCEPLDPTHHLCAKGYAALEMAKSLLVDSDPEEAWNPAAPLLDAVLAELRGAASCPDPIECGHEAALGQAQQEIRRLGLTVDEYGHGASTLSEKLKGVRDAVAFAERVVATSGPGPAGAVQAVIDRLRAALDPQPAVVPAGAGEEPADETQTCGQTKGVSGAEYPPCARDANHEQAYCRSEDSQYFIAVVSQPGKEH